MDPVPLLDLKAQYRTVRGEIAAAVERVLEDQQFILGEEVEAFEREMAALLGTRHAVGCASGSDALLLALMALDLSPGAEVITTPYTFFATVSAITRLGLRPVLCDIEPRTFNLDPCKIEEAVTPLTRAAIVVHLFGQCAALGPILELARRHGLALIEDVAQALGAQWEGKAAGAVGDAGCFSFFPAKILGAYGDAGLIVTCDEELAARLRTLRVHGMTRRYLHERVGINSRLDALQAAILRAKLPRLEEWIAARGRAAETYRELFAGAGLTAPAGCVCDPPPGRVILPEALNGRHAFGYYVVRANADQRNGLREHLQAHGVGCAVYYPVPLHLQPCFAEIGYRAGDFPASEQASREALALPIYPELTRAQQERVVATMKDFLARW
jgi:dTDP-4-amino-4,6-dideoxygalactose transaminase